MMTENIVHSVQRAFSLIEAISDDAAGKGVLQLAEETQLPPSTVHRALRTLCRIGYVAQETRSERYRLTGKLLAVAAHGLTGKNVRMEAARFLPGLRDATRESAYVAVLDGMEAVTVEAFPSPHRNLVECRLGERHPLHCTAAGKCLLAFQQQDQLENMLARMELVRCTPYTLCSVAELRRHLEQVRQAGCALDWDEREEGIRCIAAPVRDASGVVAAAIGISGPNTRLKEENLPELTAQVTGSAREFSHALGCLG